MSRTITNRQARAIGYQLADEIETRAQPLMQAGIPRDKAIMLTIAKMSGHLSIVRG